MKILFTTLHYVLIAAIAAVALLVVATLTPVGGLKVKIVQSGSMEPTIMTGGIVVDRAASDYQVGDIVTFGLDTKTQIPTTHRIVGIAGQGSSAIYQTKGDANDAPDQASTHLSDIHGKVLFTIPYVGYVLAFARTPIGFALLVGLPALFVILDEVGKIVREARALRRKKEHSHAASESQLQPKPTPARRRIVD